MNIYRIEEITLKPMIVLAHDMEDAVNIFAYELVMGLGHRPDADFSVVQWRPKASGPARPVLEWAEQGHRGTVWSVDDGAGWELSETNMVEP
jgi:hypothetical protein